MIITILFHTCLLDWLNGPMPHNLCKSTLVLKPRVFIGTLWYITLKLSGSSAHFSACASVYKITKITFCLPNYSICKPSGNTVESILGAKLLFPL